MVGALTDMLLRGPLHTMFMTRTTFIPELLYSGTIVIMNMPVHEYNDAGKFAQVLFKTVVQRMLERRSDLDRANRDAARPIFLWADEAQFFATPQDTMFQTTARSSRVATVYMTQNLPNYYDAFGADSGGRDRAKKLLGAFGIKIFHANGDLETNDYAERLFGKHHVWRESHGTNESETWGKATGGSSYSKTLGSSRNWTQVLESQYQAKVLTELRRGGKERRFTEAIIFRAGDVWKATGTNILPLRFPQDFDDIPTFGRGSA
jgi:type IV secretory pathway TraG/TraD family ATPase VirD4